MSVDGKLKILIVEDDEFLSGMYVTKFTLEGFVVNFAGDGEEGLRKAREVQPHLILLDVLLPKRDGFEVLQELKKDASTRSIPVILLTNLSQESDIKKGRELGAEDYLVKAYNIPSEVVAKVKARLGISMSAPHLPA
ncbi:hypothetical protein A3J43_02765 [Candidatus Uhrbacteria bacterium RIFCSPHIGHO2_12_FULL_54_23]|uniref:Response regulatory domain-containing protein n=3 Tax=Candidatus Uhriibacteriota TaxID=1752732 RepID=A0A1F7UII2_9BACT|nr:MAG: hypothetical protein A3J43_02765 [Candidatus Uhrbacteria bacterium RIFCSPHIGHO2_12_FULL_54_23]OGL85115.1 MAG: hypothetical protein A3B36_02020 [Candidatus Uhrbacteria bacterium RIFCSPLOWO2_01_FULL_55_36]OGL91199.1 MAG: hypothetical protein A3J36_01610 [Candidatus Uhrbacteria bacterium RIFCSPLOWO2_02_FULL_54_37]